MDVITLISEHEGNKLKAYVDTRGKVTIGRGRNLTDKGISFQECLMLFQDDFTEALSEALRYPWYNELNEPRQAVIVDMVFNLGAARFAQFTRMHEAIAEGNFKQAALEMRYSAWAEEVPSRATQDADIMDSGTWA